MVDLQSMSDVEIGELAVRCLDALSLSERVQAVLKAVHSKDDRDELIEWLNEANAEEEAETEGEEEEED